MREIKFRAWVAAKKESWTGVDGYETFDFSNRMREVSSLHFPLGSFSGKDVTLIPISDDDLFSGSWHCIEGEHEAEVILMQYTGLKDNSENNTCIYEGDIVSLEGIVKGNIYEMDKGEADIVIQDFGGKDWCKTYNEAILRGCRHTE